MPYHKNPCLNDLKWLKKYVKTVRPSIIYFSILRTEGLDNIQQVNNLLSQYGGKRGKKILEGTVHKKKVVVGDYY